MHSASMFLQWVFYLTIIGIVGGTDKSGNIKNGTVFSEMELKLTDSVSEYVDTFTRSLEKFNDKHLGDTYLGKLLRYNYLKPKLGGDVGEGRTKKIHTSLLPLIFHVGASSTWVLLTTLLTAKSVAIGMLLLIFKIAVSSAKVSAFFTALKQKDHHHHDWSWNPHHEHGHERSITFLDSLNSYSPNWHSKKDTLTDWSPGKHATNYKTIPDSVTTKDVEPYGGYEYADDQSRGV